MSTFWHGWLRLSWGSILQWLLYVWQPIFFTNRRLSYAPHTRISINMHNRWWLCNSWLATAPKYWRTAPVNEVTLVQIPRYHKSSGPPLVGKWVLKSRTMVGRYSLIFPVTSKRCEVSASLFLLLCYSLQARTLRFEVLNIDGSWAS